MLKLITLTTLSVAAALLSAAVFAAGLHSPGRVDISEGVNDDIMVASMNVRHNAAAQGSPYVQVYGWANNAVTFLGNDGRGKTFSCFVLNTSALYQAALDAKNGAGDGSTIVIHKRKGKSECAQFQLSHSSNSLQ